MPFVPDEPTSGRFVPDAPAKAAEGFDPLAGIKGAADTAASLVSGAVAPAVAGIAGLGASVLPGEPGQGARTVERVQDAMTYQPRTKAGKTITDVVSWPFQKLAEGADKAGGAVAEKTGSPLAGTAVNTAIQGIPLALAPALKRAGPIKSAVEKNPKLAANVAEAKDAGYAMTPEEAGAGVVSKTAASLAGEPKLAKLTSKKNQETHNRLIAEDLGLPKDTVLDRETIAKVRAEAGKDYEAVRNTGRVTADADYVKALDEIVADYQGAAKDFPGRANPVLDLVERLKQPAFDANSAVSEINSLRRDATAAFKKQEHELAFASLDAAEALESQLGRHLQATGQPKELIDAFRSARVRIAKAHAADKALVGDSGNINPQAYASMLEKKKLTGGAETVGKFASSFPRSAQKPSAMPTGPTAFDAVLGGLSGEWKYALARPAVREALASKLGQYFMRPKNWSAAEIARQVQSTRGVAGAETSEGQRK